MRKQPTPGPEPHFLRAARRRFGRTDLNVSAIGIGGGMGIPSRDVEYGVEAGINVLFFSSDLHHFKYRSMVGAIRRLCGRSSSTRESMVLAVVTYIKTPEMILAALFDQFCELRIDYVDLFIWGWMSRRDTGRDSGILATTPKVRGPGTIVHNYIEQICGASERMKRLGAVRYIGASFHDVSLANECLTSPWLDVAMVRHNPAHPAARKLVFEPAIEMGPSRPGIMTFNSSVGAVGSLASPPRVLKPTDWRPTIPDFYRYNLAQPAVDVCLTGPRRRSDIVAAIAAANAPPLSNEEMAYLAQWGADHRALAANVNRF